MFLANIGVDFEDDYFVVHMLLTQNTGLVGIWSQ